MVQYIIAETRIYVQTEYLRIVSNYAHKPGRSLKKIFRLNSFEAFTTLGREF